MRRVEEMKMRVKKVARIALVGIVVLIVIDRFPIWERWGRWNVTWNASQSSFRVSGKKNAGERTRGK